MDRLDTIKKKSEELAEVRRKIEKVDAEYNRVVIPFKETRDALQEELLALLREADLKTIKASSGETFTRASRKSIVVVDEPKAVEWAKERDLVKVDLTRAKSAMKGLEALPEGFGEQETEYMSIRGVKND